MAMIYVKARPDIVYPYEGKNISPDKFIPVADIPYIRRGVEVWGDLELQGAAPKAAPPPRAAPSPASAPVPAPPKPQT